MTDAEKRLAVIESDFIETLERLHEEVGYAEANNWVVSIAEYRPQITAVEALYRRHFRPGSAYSLLMREARERGVARANAGTGGGYVYDGAHGETDKTFAKLVGTGVEVDFYGVCGNCFKLGDTVFEAEEDEADGYRSYLRTVQVAPEVARGKVTFSYAPIARVRVIEVDEIPSGPSRYETSPFEGWALEDVATGHRWLYVGTDTGDDYYPMFVFCYTLPGEEVDIYGCVD